MKKFSILSLGAMAVMATSPAVAQDQGLANFGAGGDPQNFGYANAYIPSGMEFNDYDPKVPNSHLGPQRTYISADTGMTYVITYLPSGRALFRDADGVEFVYNPRTKETITQ